MYISRKLLQVLVIPALLLQAGVVDLTHSNSYQGGLPLTNGSAISSL
ncbi:hypothetical protein GWK48_10865 [Metallosphaera tengchongensis]|uniref:Uncharacterized protein n=1 Tax=Metallosphaera tengchongensis TaxID=1532350 RepID=A0A6N0NZN1_9CREN|nr:hypothetical protein [Metallosphaera tengchongensis]QKR00818.1 hypothetical protein GWK48_10865 [Metallosphaera tengchongensis]